MNSNHYFKNVVFLPLSDEAETGSGGDQPARNTLTKRNGKQGAKYSPTTFLFHFSRLCLRKRMTSLESKKNDKNNVTKNKQKKQLLT
jgi:hypothetical protein